MPMVRIAGGDVGEAICHPANFVSTDSLQSMLDHVWPKRSVSIHGKEHPLPVARRTVQNRHCTQDGPSGRNKEASPKRPPKVGGEIQGKGVAFSFWMAEPSPDAFLFDVTMLY